MFKAGLKAGLAVRKVTSPYFFRFVSWRGVRDDKIPGEVIDSIGLTNWPPRAGWPCPVGRARRLDSPRRWTKTGKHFTTVWFPCSGWHAQGQRAAGWRSNSSTKWKTKSSTCGGDFEWVHDIRQKRLGSPP